MDSNLGKNQSYARKINSKLVISKLRNSDKSATVLVDELNLSNSAMSSILKGLELQGAIIPSYSISASGKGRKQIYYTLNKDYGVFAIVCLSNNRYKIILSNLKEEILIKEEREINGYDITIIYEIILTIKNMLAKEEYRDLPLKNIFIAIPGKVNSITGEIQLSKHFDKSLFDEDNKISKLFETHFNTSVIIRNDINLAIIGEKRSGALVNSKNALLLYVDNGIGASMIFNNEFYNGSNGYAGEVGLMRTTFHGQENALDEFVSLRSIKEYIYQKTNKKLKTNEVITLYNNDKEIHDYINETAHLLGKKLKDILELLNISQIVIQGRICGFKEDYLNCIREEMNKSNNQYDIQFSKLNGDSIFIGAMSEAVDYLIDDIISNNLN